MSGSDAAPDPAERWHALWRRIGAAGDGAAELADLTARYREPARHYHTLEHIVHCLEELDRAVAPADRPDEAELALWFHDAVYDPRAGDNEARSAALADRMLGAAGIEPAARERIGSMIIATTHAAAPRPGDTALVCDADLAILGSTPERYHRYVQQIGAEYAWVPEPVFRQTRATVLERLLARPSLYATAGFREKYEQRARRNLSAELDRLRR